MRAAARGATKRERERVPTASNTCGPGFELDDSPAGGYAVDSTMRPTAQHQHASSRATAMFATTGLLPASSSALRLSMSLRLPLSACRPTAGSTGRPRAGGLARLEALAKCHPASTPFMHLSASTVGFHLEALRLPRSLPGASEDAAPAFGTQPDGVPCLFRALAR